VTEPSDTAVFRLGYVPGVTPGKWVRIWAERRPHVPLELVTATTDEAVELIRAGAVDAALVRLPIDRTGLHTIPLYTETTVAVAPKDHVVTATEEATVADLADEIVLHPQDDTLTWPGDRPGRAAAFAPATTAEAIKLVAAGVGLLVVPQSLARLHHRRDLTYRPLIDAPGSGVGLAWPDAENTELMEEFIGIVRGRTVNSTRTPRRDPAPGTPAPTKKRVARRPSARRGTRRR
jgi:DNA-binding transcriptional LysR family regulator